jgi:antitoxin component YwqK of YwqJK toxin-antitoxin module
MIYKNEDLLDVVDLDQNGEEVYKDGNVFFTGTVQRFDNNNVLQEEWEYVNGYKEGLCSLYYPNGQKKLEYVWGDGGYNGQVKRWDDQGNLIYSKLWIGGDEQP